MFSSFSFKKINSLRSLLLYWIVGSAIAFVTLYTGLLEYQFRFGVQLRSQASLDWYANIFEASYKENPSEELPSGQYFQSFLDWENVPLEIRSVLEGHEIEHRELEIFDGDEFGDEIDVLFKTFPLCGDAECEIIFFYAYQLQDGKWLYLAQGIVGTDEIQSEMNLVENIFIVVTIVVLLTFGALAFLLVRKVSQPVKNLADWAGTLTADSRPDGQINFQYDELNLVAKKLTEAFIRISQSVEKEHQFLQQVSHELRTPLATASGNVDILNLVARDRELTAPEQNALSRLNFAINDMKQMTETLLWLNRDEQSLPEQTRFNLQSVVNSIVESNHYLLQGKQVKVIVEGTNEAINGHKVLFKILLSNLIRNAFQYTFDGHVTISLDSNSVTIVNENNQDEQCSDADDDIYGFGLGLHLVSLIATKMNWHYYHKPQPNGWYSKVTFQQ